MDSNQIEIRRAVPRDRDALREVQALSMRILGVADYAPEVIEALIDQVGTMDDVLIGDGTYFVATSGGRMVGCGGWSTRQPGYAGRVERIAPGMPECKIRSVYVHPACARRGIGSRIMARLESEVAAAGHDRATLAATLTGVPLYRRRGFVAGPCFAIRLRGGLQFPVVAMEKRIPALSDAA